MKRTFANRVGLGLTGIFQELHEGALLELEKLRGLLQGFLLRRTVAVAVLASMVMMPHSHHIHTPISLHKMATRALPMPQSCFSPMQQVQCRLYATGRKQAYWRSIAQWRYSCELCGNIRCR